MGKAIGDMGDPKKFAKDLAALTPVAQQVVLAIKIISDNAIKPLQQELQTTLFANVGPQLVNTVNQLLPAIAPGLDRIAGSDEFGVPASLTLLSSPQMVGTISSILDNIATSFERLTPAIAPAVDGIVRIIDIGSGFLPGIADAITGIANAFDQWVAANPGDLALWMQQALDAIGQLAPAIPALVEAFLSLSGAGLQLAGPLADCVVAFSNLIIASAPLIPYISNLGPLIETLTFGMTQMSTVIGLLTGNFPALSTEASNAAGALSPLQVSVDTLRLSLEALISPLMVVRDLLSLMSGAPANAAAALDAARAKAAAAIPSTLPGVPGVGTPAAGPGSAHPGVTPNVTPSQATPPRRDWTPSPVPNARRWLPGAAATRTQA